jgi:hypothetical protein
MNACIYVCMEIETLIYSLPTSFQMAPGQQFDSTKFDNILVGALRRP